MTRKVRLEEVVRTLPRHGHSLSRKTVSDSQRWRILEGMTEACAKLGYADASVADVIAIAGVSRKAFYEHFKDKEDCFLTAYDVLSDRLIGELSRLGAAHADPAERTRAEVRGFLEALARTPAAARVFMVDVLGAGPRALHKRELVNRRFAEALFGDLAVDETRRTAIVGGVNNVVVGALLHARGPRLVDLWEPLSEFVLSALEPTKSPTKRR